MCAGGVGEVQVGVCTSVVGLGKGPGLYCRGSRASGRRLSFGHYRALQITNNAGREAGQVLPHLSGVKLGLAMAVTLPSEWGMSEGRPALSLPIPLDVAEQEI